MEKQVKNEEFEELAFEEQCKVVYNTSPAHRGDLIIRSQDPERLTNSLSAEDFYLMVREMDRANVPEVVQNAHFRQLEFMADFECWDNDIISEKGFIEWLKCLEDAGSDRLALWLLNADVPMVIAGFKKYMTVLKPFHEERVDEIIGDKPYFTIDGLYYIMIDEDNMQTVQRAIELLFEKAKHYYYNLLEGIMSEMDALVEEEAFTHRNVRLETKGFPRKEDAYRIYTTIDREEWNRYAKRHVEATREERPLPLYPTLWQEEKLFLDDVLATLAQVPREVQTAIYQELVWLCNKIITVRGMHHFGEALVKESFAHARHILNIALEDLSECTIEKAHGILTEHLIEYIFRWGYTPLIAARDNGERIIKSYWDYSLARLFEFLDDPFGPYMQGIMSTRPQLYDPRVSGELYQLRDFKNKHEVRMIHHTISVIENVFKLLSSKSFNGWHRFMHNQSPAAHIDASDVKLSTIIFTLFSRFVLNNSFSLKPLDSSELKKFLTYAFMGHTEAAHIKNIRPDLKAGFIKQLSAHVDCFSPGDFNSLKDIFELSFTKGEEELGLLQRNKKPHTYFIHCLLLKPSQNN